MVDPCKLTTGTGRQVTRDKHSLGTGEKRVFSETIVVVLLFSYLGNGERNKECVS